MRYALAALAVAGVAGLGPAVTAAGEAPPGAIWFYCGGRNPSTSVVAVSAVFPGSVEQLDDHKREFASYLTGMGLLPPGGEVACAGESSEGAAAAALKNATTLGPADAPTVRFARLDWIGRAPAPAAPATVDDGSADAERLNRGVAERNAAVAEANRKAQEEYEAALARVKAETVAAQVAYRAEVSRHEAEVARVNAEAERQKQAYAEQMKAWAARVAACQRGDVSKCASTP